MLLTRVITAAVLLAVLTLSIYIGPFAFASVMAIAFGATLYEWLRIGGRSPSRSSRRRRRNGSPAFALLGGCA